MRCPFRCRAHGTVALRSRGVPTRRIDPFPRSMGAGRLPLYAKSLSAQRWLSPGPVDESYSTS